EILFERIPLFLKLCFQQLYLLLPISLLGLFLVKNRGVMTFLLLALLGNLFFGLSYQRFDISPYFIVSFLILSIFLAHLLEWVKDSYLHRSSSLAMLALIPLSLLVMNHGQVDQSKNTAAAIMVESVLEKIGQDAIIISTDFTQHEYFLYYLIGEGLEKKNVYAVNPDEFSVEAIQSYLRGEKSLYLPLKRIEAPLQLSVYVLSPIHRQLLERSGIRLQQEDPNLYRILK
ncbi:MAG: hypothetical protein Q8P95_00180, partial [bacterium]|nr:hypothetical protein [bacterium]